MAPAYVPRFQTSSCHSRIHPDSRLERKPQTQHPNLQHRKPWRAWSVLSLCPYILRARHPPAPRVCGLPPLHRPLHLRHPSRLRPRTRSLPRAIHPRSLNQRFRRRIIPVSLLIVPLSAIPLPRWRTPRSLIVSLCESVFSPHWRWPQSSS
jgi:hypothetical protein